MKLLPWHREAWLQSKRETGSGKTETAKLYMGYIGSTLSGFQSSVDEMPLIVDQVFESLALVEAFGNAKTQPNRNASRATIHTRLHFSGAVNEKQLAGATFDVHLLDKHWVVGRKVRGSSLLRSPFLWHSSLCRKRCVQRQMLCGCTRT